jgi:hypothetical protein
VLTGYTYKPDQFDLRIIEDRRQKFEKFPKRIDGTPARITENSYDSNKRRGFIYSKTAFVDPKNVVICKRRKRRRKILFKIRKIGKGKAGPKRRIRNFWSDIRC